MNALSRFAETMRLRPSARCPKCGDLEGFAESGPRYGTDYEIGKDSLSWECCTCGYTIVTRTADAPEYKAVAIHAGERFAS